jgi:hypothetical protein
VKQYLNRISQWLVAVLVAVALVQSIVLPANAIPLFPGDDFIDHVCPQIEISAFDCPSYESGVYSLGILDNSMPITNRNFVPCAPGAIDSYFLSGGDLFRVENIGNVPIEVDLVCR